MSPTGSHRDTVPKQGNAIGQIFRAYGEQYIRAYKPYIDEIKFIRAIRVCKTPALGGTVVKCKSCHHPHPIYYSCGHSRCPICQSIKREQWLDKLQATLLAVPYVHLVTTMPHDLNGLARRNPKAMYNLLFRATKQTMWKIIGDDKYVGAVPGMIKATHLLCSSFPSMPFKGIDSASRVRSVLHFRQ